MESSAISALLVACLTGTDGLVLSERHWMVVSGFQGLWNHPALYGERCEKILLLGQEQGWEEWGQRTARYPSHLLSRKIHKKRHGQDDDEIKDH